MSESVCVCVCVRARALENLDARVQRPYMQEAGHVLMWVGVHVFTHVLFVLICMFMDACVHIPCICLNWLCIRMCVHSWVLVCDVVPVVVHACLWVGADNSVM